MPHTTYIYLPFSLKRHSFFPACSMACERHAFCLRYLGSSNNSHMRRLPPWGGGGLSCCRHTCCISEAAARGSTSWNTTSPGQACHCCPSRRQEGEDPGSGRKAGENKREEKSLRRRQACLPHTEDIQRRAWEAVLACFPQPLHAAWLLQHNIIGRLACPGRHFQEKAGHGQTNGRGRGEGGISGAPASLQAWQALLGRRKEEGGRRRFVASLPSIMSVLPPPHLQGRHGKEEEGRHSSLPNIEHKGKWTGAHPSDRNRHLPCLKDKLMHGCLLPWCFGAPRTRAPLMW